MPHAYFGSTALVLITTVAGCDLGGVTATEMRMAVDETVATGQAESMQTDIIEISTSFTLGDAFNSALLNIEAFVNSQAPCSTVTPTGERGLVIDFGELGDACTYRDRTYAGTITIELEDTPDGVVVHHSLAALTNGKLTIDGDADVTWTSESRRVQTDLTFVRADSTTELTADRTIKLLDDAAGLAGGIIVDGERQWTNQRGEFDLTIASVEMRPVDPVPQAGSYHLALPNGGAVDLAFTRIDSDTIEVRVSGGRRDRVFHVSTTGTVDALDAG